MVFIVKSNVLFLEEIYCVLSNEVEFRSMGFDFEHLRGNFGHQGVACVSSFCLWESILSLCELILVIWQPILDLV